MSRAFLTKTSFASGELDPLLAGRLDLRAQEDGAAKLRNMVVLPTGGVSRRPGLSYLATLQGAVRLIPFDGPDGIDLLAIGAYRLWLLRGGKVSGAVLPTPWAEAEVAALSWARWGDRLFLCHPEVPPHELVRGLSGAWEVRPWTFERAIGAAPGVGEAMPFAKFATPEAILQVGNGADAPVTTSGNPVVQLVANEPVFTAQHVGVLVRFNGRNLRITGLDPLQPTKALAAPLENLPSGAPTRDWAEQAFSQARGWPRTVAVHQERLVIGGSRDLSDRLWFSRTGRPMNFDPGTGLADEAWSFRLVGDERHDIQGLFATRHLQVFTRVGEWVVRGMPLTPSSVQAELQTRIGSWRARTIPPFEVDGATLFIGASGRELREFLYSDSEQAYQAADLALLARHLLEDPVAAVFDREGRRLLIAREDGRLAAVTIDRTNNVVAWSLLDTLGAIRSLAPGVGGTYCLVELDGATFLERFDTEAVLDHGVSRTSAAPTRVWGDLAHLEGRDVVLLDPAGTEQRAVVIGGTAVAAEPITALTIGIPFTCEIEPLPLAVPGIGGSSLDRPYRPVRVVFRIHDTPRLRADTGAGPRCVALPGPAGRAYSGDAAAHATGWRRGRLAPPWRIRQDDPVRCTILAVTTEIRGSD